MPMENRGPIDADAILKGWIKKNHELFHCDHTCPHCGKDFPTKEITSAISGTVLGRVWEVCGCLNKHREAELAARELAMTREGIERKFADRMMNRRWLKCTFDNFQEADGSDQAFRMAVKYAETFAADQEEGLMIWGEPGNGKTHLMAAVAAEVKSRGLAVVMLSVPSLLEMIRSTFDKDTQDTEAGLIRLIQRADLVILDDIGSENPTGWVRDVLFRIIDGRYQAMKPVCYTSNDGHDQLGAKLGEKIKDRIIGSCLIVENKARSWREYQAMERMQKIRGE